MSLVKYRVYEVAKDFGVNSKEIMSILDKYSVKPSTTQKVLEDQDLTIIFDYLTQQHQVDDFESLFAEEYHEPKEEPKQEKTSEGKDTAGGKEKSKTETQTGKGKETEQKKESKPARPARRVPEKKVVDTRKGGGVNLSKYDEKLENMAAGSSKQMQGGKQKLPRNGKGKNNYQGSKRRQEEQEKMRRLQASLAKKKPTLVKIPDEIAVNELALRMKKTVAEVVRTLVKDGVMASASDVIDFDTASIVAEEMGCKVEKEVIVTIEERLIDTAEDKEEDLKERAPVVVVMGHVDHGKTSLLDYVRHTNVAEGEAGGITQHIGAYQVTVNDRPITFLDTPGHEAFTAMRARGAMVTDVAILVVAADDGIMPQTVESINHAKAAEIPIIVAINKMDLEGANPDRVKQQLTEYGLVSEEWGGDTIIVPISAKTGMGIEDLLDMVLLTAEMQELKANPNRSAHGVVIEGRLDKGRGSVATLLVQNGTLKQGDVIIAGTAVGRIRSMTNARGERIKEAGPSVPVEVVGLSEVPDAGEAFHAVEDEKMARTLVEQRKHEKKESSGGGVMGKTSLEDLFSRIQEGEMKHLNLIIKADVQGSAEALKNSLEKLTNDEVKVTVLHSAAGGITESDVMLASASDAIIVGFNVRPDRNAEEVARRQGVELRMYRVIYEAIDEIEKAMKGMMEPKFREVDLGRVEVREVYKVTGTGMVAGCYVTEGKVEQNANLRLVREGIVVHEGTIASLRRFKDDVKEVTEGLECGITIDSYQDLKVGDGLEVFRLEQIEI